MTTEEVPPEPTIDAGPNGSGGERWTVRADESHVGFRVRKMGMYDVKGRFRRIEGHVTIDPDGVPSRGEVVIDAASVSTRIPPRDWHLRTKDFLGVRRHPEIRVTARKGPASAGHDLQVAARAEILGTERDLTLRAHPHDDGGSDRVVVHLRGELDRRDFGMRARIPFEWIVARRVEIDVTLVLERDTADSS